MTERYDYENDVPASPQELEYLRDICRDYLVGYGDFSWGTEYHSNPDDAPGFYGFYADENGIDPIPITDSDGAPTYYDELSLKEIQFALPAQRLGVLGLRGAHRLDITYTEASQTFDPDDGEEPVQDWNLNISIFSGSKRALRVLHTIEICEVPSDEESDAFIDSTISRPESEVSTDLMRLEYVTLEALFRSMPLVRLRHGRHPSQ